MTLGEKIQKLRKQRGLSQEALAEKVTVTRQTISKWELGQSTPDLDFIAQLSDIFNVSSDYLIKDEMTEPDELPYKKRNYRLSERGKRIILVIVSAAALIAGCVSSIEILNAFAMFHANTNDGLCMPFSNFPIVSLRTPTNFAKSSCFISYLARYSLILFFSIFQAPIFVKP